MTTPDQRTKAVRETRQFLETVRGTEDEILWDLVRTMAGQLLRHYPMDADLSGSARALPGVWGPPWDTKIMTAAADRRRAATTRAAPTAMLDELAGVVFLNIDNTLHASDAFLFEGKVLPESHTSTLFEFAPILEQLLGPYPALAIVLSSSWVEVLGYDFTVAQLPSDSLRARVRGATFEKEDAVDEGWAALPRGTQVLRFVKRHRLHRWLAIDDVRSGFDGYEGRVVHCQVGVGLGDKDVQQVLARRLEIIFGPPDSCSLSSPSTPDEPT
ncbi:BPSL0761 family protein (plasmid) [Paraburkholderia strydomiana]